MNEVLYKQLMCEIQETEFACVELFEFLDTHPNSQKAKEQLMACSINLRELKERFDREIAPLHNFGYSTSNGSWVCTTPWPWELQ